MGNVDTKTLLRSIRETTRRADRLARGKAPGLGARARRAVALIAACALALILFSIALPPFAYPVEGRKSSGFFWRHSPDSLAPFAVEFHPGLDLAVPRGTPVRAAAAGRVAATGYDDLNGHWVRVRHLFGFESFYAHLDSVGTKAGAIILLRGLSVLGRSGSTGRSTGPHLHFELRIRAKALPPSLMLLPHRIRLGILGF